MNVALSMKVALTKRDMTQAVLAERLKSSPSYISALAKGKAAPSEDMLKRMCEVLDMKVSEFIALGED